MGPTYRLSSAEFASVSSLDGPTRFKHFVSRVADWGQIWGLKGSAGWVSAGDDNQTPGFPLWPHPDYATACATVNWADCQPTPIDINDFMQDWLPDMAEKGVALAVFPTIAMKGVVLSAMDLQDALRAELDRYE